MQGIKTFYEVQVELEQIESGRTAFWSDDSKKRYLYTLLASLDGGDPKRLAMQDTEAVRKRIHEQINKCIAGR